MAILPTFVAVTVVVGCLFGAVNQILVILVIIKKCDIKENSSFLLIISLACSDFIQLIIHTFGAIEAAIGHYIVPVGMELFLGQLHNSLFGVLCAHLMAMAINRFCAVFYLTQFKIIFSRKRTLITIVCCWLYGFFYGNLRLFWCCRIVYNLILITFAYDFSQSVDGDVPLAYTDNTLSLTSAIIPTVIYVMIAIKLIKVTAAASNSTMDAKLCWQFFFILAVQVVYVSGWQVIPRVTTDVRWFYFISYMSVMNFSINPYIYYIFNKKIRKGVAELAFGWMGYTGATTNPTNAETAARNTARRAAWSRQQSSSRRQAWPDEQTAPHWATSSSQHPTAKGTASTRPPSAALREACSSQPPDADQASGGSKQVETQ